jgi:hypothetical protein
MEHLRDTLKSITKFAGGIVVAGVAAYATYSFYEWTCKRKKTSKSNSLARQNIISVVNELSDSIVDDAFGTKDKSITLKTYIKFAKAYENVDKDQDINIVILTPGGEMGAVEAIVNLMMSHNASGRTGRFIAHIPYYVYSGGMALALACHEIRMLPRSVAGPCDGQLHANCVRGAASSIITAVETKRDRGEPVGARWLVAYNMSMMCQTRQHTFINKLVAHGILTPEVGMKAYDELFSGKYNHDITFSSQNLIDIGLNVTLVEAFSDEINSLVKDVVQ